MAQHYFHCAPLQSTAEMSNLKQYKKGDVLKGTPKDRDLWAGDNHEWMEKVAPGEWPHEHNTESFSFYRAPPLAEEEKTKQ